MEEDLVTATWMFFAAKEVVEADFVERGCRRIRRDVTTHANSGTLCPMHHDRRIPAGIRSNAAFECLIAGEPRLSLRRNGIDVVSAAQAGDTNILLRGAAQQRQHDVASAVGPRVSDQGVEGLEPLRGLTRINVDVLGG